MMRILRRTFALFAAFACLAVNQASAEPVITQVRSPASDSDPGTYYGLGTTIVVVVQFDTHVAVTLGANPPVLELATAGSSNALAVCTGIDPLDAHNVLFEYYISRGQKSARLDYTGINAITLNDGTITDFTTPSTHANLALPAPGDPGSLSATKNLVVATPPIVMAVSSTTSDQTLGTGAEIAVNLTFSEPVNKSGAGTPLIELATAGTSNAFALYSSGSGTADLGFLYNVEVGHQTYPSDLDYASANALTTPNSTIQAADTFALNADLSLPAPGGGFSLTANHHIKIDTPAVVTNVVATTADGTYGLASEIDILVQFSASVENTDVAKLLLDVGQPNVYASRTGAVSGEELAFKYNVGAGENAARLAYVDAASLSGVFVKNAHDIDPSVVLTLPLPGQPGSLNVNNNIIIDTTPPVVTSYTPANGATGVGVSSALQITFNKNISKGTGDIKLIRSDDGVEHDSLPVTDAAVVVADNVVTINFVNPLESLTNYYVTIASTAFNDGIGNDYPGISDPSTWHFTAEDLAGPHVTYVTSTTDDGAYSVGVNINVRVYFSESIEHDGSHSLRLATGGSGRNATFSMIGDNYVDFIYVVQAGDNTSRLQYFSTDAFVNEAGAWIRDLSDNDADLTLPALISPDSLASNKNIVIDTMPPTVVNVTSTTANGIYTSNEVINVRVQFSEQVTVNGSPRVQLHAGGSVRDAVYTGGSGTAYLDFEYTVVSGDFSTNLNYMATNSLANSPGGNIRDAAGNAANLTLPALDAPTSLGSNKDIVIDTIRPQIRNVTSITPDGYYRADAVLDVRLEISKPVSVLGPHPVLTLNSGPGAEAVYVAVQDETNVVFSYQVKVNENSPSLDYASASALQLMGAIIRDDAGNELVTTLPAPGAAGSLSDNKNLVIDTTPPIVALASDSTSPTNGAPILFIATFNETVSNFQASAINIGNGSLVPTNFTGQVGTVFRFHVQPTGAGSEVVQIITASLGAGAAQDLAGNLSLASEEVSRIYDTVRPFGVMSSTSYNPTEIVPISVTVLFNDTMRDFTAGCVRATNATIINFSGSGAAYSFQLLPLQPGIVRANIDDGIAHDLAGNPCYASAAFVREYVFPASAWLNASDGAYADRVALEWAPVSGAVAYRILRNTANDSFFASNIGVVQGSTTYNDTTAVPGTSYYYWVRPVNVHGGIGLVSASDQGWRGLGAPTGFYASDGTYGDRIAVSWNATPNATLYELYRSTDSSFANATLIARPVEPAYADMQAGVGAYYYWVRAISAIGASAFAGPESGWRYALGDALNNTLLEWRTGGSNDWFAQTQVTHDGFAAAQSGAIGDNGFSWLETTVVGPGSLGFWWRVSSETNRDYLCFAVDGEVLSEITGESGWQHLVFDISAGVHVLRWNYKKDHSRFDGADAGWLDEVSYSEMPRNLVASDGVYRDRVRLTWFGSFVPGAAYRVYRSATPNHEQAIALGDTTDSWFDDVSMVPGRVYYYWIQALSDHGSSAFGEFDQGHARQVDYDYNADGRADLAVYNRAADSWYITTISGSILAFNMPTTDSKIANVALVPADYNGDGAVDVGVYNEASGAWYIKSLANGVALVWALSWGGPGCTAVPGDYDGDGRADLAVFVRATGEWFILFANSGFGYDVWGWQGAEPVPADYNGDGCTDLAVFDRVNGRWFAKSYAGNVLHWNLQWGWNTAVALPADYDGDGKADFGVYDMATGYWYILGADHNLLAWAVPWGFGQMIPVPADYDGDGRTDLAVYAPQTGNWYIWTWTGAVYTDLRWGFPPLEPVVLGR